jgi:site-specific recombinase XerD
MAKPVLPILAGLLHSFFHEWLVEQRDASHRTILAYRDTWRLFLRFVAQQLKRQVSALRTEDLTEAALLAFLQHIERDRQGSVGTRNCRLAAIRSFFSFVADREPHAAKQCAEVLRVPFKRAPRKAMCCMESAEVAAILAQPNRTTAGGQRDHAILSLLFNTGARIQEALDLRPQDIRLKSPTHVRLMGKGKKERISPLWQETADVLAALLRRCPRRADEPLFINRYGKPLTASGFRFRLRQYVRAAAERVPTLVQKRVTPHVFRRTTAVQLVAAGVDVTVIRSWLGHVKLETTNHYAEANIETKRKALEQVDPKLRPSKPPRWKRDADLLTWLDSL